MLCQIWLLSSFRTMLWTLEKGVLYFILLGIWALKVTKLLIKLPKMLSVLWIVVYHTLIWNMQLKISWQREWSYQLNNKLQGIKPHISVWPSVTRQKIDVILTRLRIGHSRITHRHLLLGHYSTFINWLSWIATYLQAPSPNLKDLLGENHHHKFLNFLRDANFYYDI